LETKTPVILTTSKLLSTGVDAPTCKNIVLARVIGSMTEFKQIIGRGTRVRDDYGKLFFSILDYTGSATQMFADPAFDGDPLGIEIEDGVHNRRGSGSGKGEGDGQDQELPDEDAPRKYYVDGGRFEIATHYVSELDPDGKQLRVIRFTDYAAEKVRTLYPTASELRVKWSDLEQRAEIVAALEERGIDFEAWLARQGSRRPIPLTCSAIWPLMRPCKHAGNGLSNSGARSRTSSGSTDRRPELSWKSFWISTRSMERRSSRCRRC